MAPGAFAALFRMSDQEIEPEATKLARAAVGSDPDAQMAYLTAGALLTQHAAISEWVAENPDWREALPEVLTVGEALTIAHRDYLLDKPQMEQLKAQLQSLL